MSTTTNLEHLVINYLTEAQYEAALSNNQINENQLYITPFSSDDLANYTAGDGIDITNKIISVDSNLTVLGDTAYLQYTEPIDVTKQDVLVSGLNIKTINNQSILGSGNIAISTNLVDGNATGSTRGIGTTEEGSGYSIGNYALTTGVGTTSPSKSQTTIGEYNVTDTSGGINSKGQYAFIIGNGIDNNTRSNAFTVDWQGNTQIKKALTVGANSNITGALQVGALENDYGLNDLALLLEETKEKWNTILGNGALANLLAGDVGGRVATSGGGAAISNMEWNLVDTVTGTTSVTIPELVFTYNENIEILIGVSLDHNNSGVTVYGSFLIPNNNNIWVMNGYVTSSTDWGLIDFNLSDHGSTIELNNCYYAATQHNTDATISVYYRAEDPLLFDLTIDAWTEILGGDPSLFPASNNIALTGSLWLLVLDPLNLPTNITLGNNNLMYKTSSDRNTVILTGTLSVNLAAVSITDTTIDIPLGFNVSRIPSTAVELPLGIDGDQSYAVANIKVETTGAVSLIILVIDNGAVATELSLGFSGSFFPLV